MGIPGFDSFLRQTVNDQSNNQSNDSSTSQSNTSSLQVDLCAVSDAFHQVQLDSITQSTDPSIKPRPLTLLVDTYAVIFHCLSLDQSNKQSSHQHALPEYSRYEQFVSTIVSLFRRHGINLVWYIDSSGIGSIKEKEHIRRNEQKLSEVAAYFDWLHHPSSRPPNINGHPHCITGAISAALRACNCEVRVCIGEADPVLTIDAIMHGIDNQSIKHAPSWSGTVYGILSRDSDFAITHGIRYLNIEDITFIAESQSKPSHSINQSINEQVAPTIETVIHLRHNSSVATDDQSNQSPTQSITDTIKQSNITSICGRVYSVASVAALLDLPANRLTELSFLCGNDYSKPVARICWRLKLADWRYSGQQCLLNPGQTLENVIQTLVHLEQITTQSIDDVGVNLHDRIRSYIAFLQNVEENFGPSVLLDQISPFKQVIEAQADVGDASFRTILDYSRRVYEQVESTNQFIDQPVDQSDNQSEDRETEMSELMSSLGLTDRPLYLKPSVYAFLSKGVQEGYLPRFLFGMLSNGVYHSTIWWESPENFKRASDQSNSESINQSIAQTQRFRGADSPVILPSVDSIVRPLLISIALLFNMNGLRLFETQDMTLTAVESFFDNQLPLFQKELVTLNKSAKRKSGSKAPSLRAQFLRMHLMTVKMDLLDLMFTEVVKSLRTASQSSIQSSNQSSSQSNTKSAGQLQLFHFEVLSRAYPSLDALSVQRLRLPILISRWFLMIMHEHICVARASQPSLKLPSVNQLQHWVAAFLQSVIVLEAVQALSGDSSMQFRVMTKSSNQPPSPTSVSVFSCWQAIYTMLSQLLSCLDMCPARDQHEVLTDMIPQLNPAEMFHGELFAAIAGSGDTHVDDKLPSMLTMMQKGVLQLELTSQNVTIDHPTLLQHLHQHMPDRYHYVMSSVLRRWGQCTTFDEYVARHSVLPVASKSKAVKVAPAPVVDPSQLSEEELAAIDFREGGFRSIRSLVRLPIDRVSSQFLQQSLSNALMIVKGATGSGKSSRTPPLILRLWYDRETTRIRDKNRQVFEKKFKGELPASLKRHPFIVVTQPRRIAAITLCKRVSEELGVPVGQACGFAVGQDSVRSDKTRILFVTTGWLATKLMHQPSFLLECSHLMVDEIHERGVQNDLLTVLVRLIVQHQLKEDAARGIDFPFLSVPRLIFMSATFSAKLFVDYFAPLFKNFKALSHYKKSESIPELTIDVFAYPVSIYWINQVLDLPVLTDNSDLIAEICPLVKSSGLLGKDPKQRMTDQMVNFVVWLFGALSVCHANDDDANCILVFLPGVSDIEQIAAAMQDSYTEMFNLASARPDAQLDLQPFSLIEVQVLYSLCDDQLKVFAEKEPGKTYVILATNIAESSVTVPNCRYVVDFGTHKEMVFDSRYQCDHLQPVLISQASAKQRAGRTGRVCTGTCIRMYTKELHDKDMQPYDKPEILRVSLASVVLSLKNRADNDGQSDQFNRHSATDLAFIQKCELNDAQHVLSQCIQPPSLESLDGAYSELLFGGAIELHGVEEVRRIIYSKQSSHDDDLSSDESDEDISFKREIFRRCRVTSLGRFYSALPFGFTSSRIVAYGILFGGRCLCTSVVIACAIGMQDVFILPSPLMTKDTADFADMIASSTRGRLEADANRCSDPLAILNIVNSFLKSRHSQRDGEYDTSGAWVHKHGVHFNRLKTLINTIREVSLRLSKIVAQPEHRTQLQQLHEFCKSGRPRAAVSAVGNHGPTEQKDDLLGHSNVPFDPFLLQLDTITQLQLQLILAVSMRTNLLQANVQPKPINSKSHIPKPGSNSSGAVGQSITDILDPTQFIQFDRVPPQLLSETICSDFPELAAIKPAVQKTHVLDKDRIVLELAPVQKSTLRLALDMFDSKSHSSGSTAVLALPGCIEQMILMRMCFNNVIKISLPCASSSSSAAGPTPSVSLTPSPSSVGPTPSVSLTPSPLVGQQLAFHRVYDNLKATTDNHSILGLLRVLKVSKPVDSKRSPYSDCKSPAEMSSSNVMITSTATVAGLPHGFIPVFAVAAAVTLTARSSLRAERVSLLPSGVLQRVGALMVAVLFGGPFTLSPDKQHIIGVSNKSNLSLQNHSDLDGISENELAELDSVSSFKSKIVPIVPSLPVSMSDAVQELHNNLQLNTGFLSRDKPHTMNMFNAVSGSTKKLTISAAFVEMIEPLIPTELLNGPLFGSFPAASKPASMPKKQVVMPKKPQVSVGSSTGAPLTAKSVVAVSTTVTGSSSSTRQRELAQNSVVNPTVMTDAAAPPPRMQDQELIRIVSGLLPTNESYIECGFLVSKFNVLTERKFADCAGSSVKAWLVKHPTHFCVLHEKSTTKVSAVPVITPQSSVINQSINQSTKQSQSSIQKQPEISNKQLPANSSSLSQPKPTISLPEQELIQIVKSLLPKDGSYMQCSVLVNNFIAHTKQKFVDCTGCSVKVWLAKHRSHFHVLHTKTTTSVSAIPMTSTHSSTSLADPKHDVVDSHHQELINLITQLLPANGSFLLCSVLAERYIAHAKDDFKKRAGHKISTWLAMYPHLFQIKPEPLTVALATPRQIVTGA